MGNKPKGSKKERAVKEVKNARIETVFLIHKIIQIAVALTMLVFSIIRIAAAEEKETVTGFMISFYLIVFALIFLFLECNVKKTRLWFYFLNSALGKAIFYIFLFLCCFGSGHAATWVDRLLAVIFSITAGIYIFIYAIFRK